MFPQGPFVVKICSFTSKTLQRILRSTLWKPAVSAVFYFLLYASFLLSRDKGLRQLCVFCVGLSRTHLWPQCLWDSWGGVWPGFQCFSVDEEEVQDGRAVRKEQMSSYRTRLVTKTHFSGHSHWRKAKGRCSGRRQAQVYSLSRLYGSRSTTEVLRQSRASIVNLWKYLNLSNVSGIWISLSGYLAKEL